MFGQEFAISDAPIIGLLIVMEGVLSIDNALVLGLLARRVPKPLQKRALTYGLVGAFVFRFICIAVASFLVQWKWAKLLGGAYLLYVALKHFLVDQHKAHDPEISVGADGHPVIAQAHPVGAAVECATAAAKAMTTHAWAFWSTVFVIEMTDIAFAVDSIVAAVGLVPNPHPEHAGPHPKLWVIITGGFLGVVLMRFAAVIFIRLLERFPRFETSAYLLVCVIGAKLVVDWQWGAHAAMPGPATRPATAPTTAATQPAGVNFHDPSSLAFWVFWGLMAACFCIGFIRPRRKAGEQA